MKRFVTALAAILLLGAAGEARANAAFFERNSSSATLSGFPIGPTPTALWSFYNLPKGKRKRVVEVEVVLTDESNNADALTVHTVLNGVPMEPGASNRVATTACDNTKPHCKVSGIFWADLDALETASPGTFIGKPLFLEIIGNTGSTSGTVELTVRTRAMKK